MIRDFIEVARTIKRDVFRLHDGPKVIRREFQKFHGRALPENPATFTDKLYHRMIDFHRKDVALFTRLSDKYMAREYIAEKVGSEYLVDLIWQGFGQLNMPFETLPYPCIAKTNHGSGMTMILRGSGDAWKAIPQFEKWLEINYYFETREYQYFRVSPRVMIEELLDDGNYDGPLDYRFWCFNGEPALVQVDNNNHTINPFYDLDWKKVDLSYRSKFSERDVPRPDKLDEMISIARRLSAEFGFVRVDLYYVKGKIYVGELTFTPAIGQLRFNPPEWDRKLGELWT